MARIPSGLDDHMFPTDPGSYGDMLPCPDGQHREGGSCVPDAPKPAAPIAPAPGDNTPPPPGPPPGNFNDPVSSQFEDIVNRTTNRLEQPVNDPRLTEALNMLRGQLNAPNPMLQAGFDALTKAMQPDPRVTAAVEQMSSQLQSLLAAQKQKEVEELKRYREYVLPRVAELRADPFTTTEEKGRRVQTFDNMERERTSTKQRVLEQLGGLGHAPTSGVVLRALEDVDRRFDALHAAGENQLLLEGTNIRDQRRANADRLMAGLPELAMQEAGLQGQQLQSLIAGLTGGIGTIGTLGLSGQELAQSGATQMGNFGIQNRGLDLNTIGQFGGLVNQIVGMDEMRMRDAVSIASMLPAMQNENIRLALQLFGTIPNF